MIRNLPNGRPLPPGAALEVAQRLGVPASELYRLIAEQESDAGKWRGPSGRMTGAVALSAFSVECLECRGVTVGRTVYAIHRARHRVYTCRDGHGCWEVFLTWRTRVQANNLAACRDMSRDKRRSGMIRELLHRVDSLSDAEFTQVVAWCGWPPEYVRDAVARLREGTTTDVLESGKAGRLLRVSDGTVRQWEDKCLLPLTVKVGRQRHWSLEELVAGIVAITGEANFRRVR